MFPTQMLVSIPYEREGSSKEINKNQVVFRYKSVSIPYEREGSSKDLK